MVRTSSTYRFFRSARHCARARASRKAEGHPTEVGLQLPPKSVKLDPF